MKNIYLMLVCFLTMFASKAQCDYTLELDSSSSGGWFGASMDLLVDGVVVLDDVTVPFSGTSPMSFTFVVDSSSDITTIWNADGSFPDELSWRILNYDGGVEYIGGAGANNNVFSGDIDVFCPACNRLSDFILNYDTPTQVTIAFTDDNYPDVNNYEYELLNLTNGDIVSGNTTNVATLVVTLPNLIAANEYQFVVFAQCSSDPSTETTFNFIAPSSGSNCISGVPLTPGIAQVGDGTGQPGDFPSDRTNPRNPCQSSFNDEEYWFEFTPLDTGDRLELNLTDITNDRAGLFIFDSCPNNTPTCISFDINLDTFDDLNITTPSLIGGTSYKIVITNADRFSNDFHSFVLNSTVIPNPDCPDVLNISTLIDFDGSLSLDWDTVAGAVGYDYEIQPQNTAQNTSGALLVSSTNAATTTVSPGVLVDGNLYTLYVRSRCSSSDFGNYQSLNFSYYVPPANDDCESPTVILASTNNDCLNKVSGTSRGATFQSTVGLSGSREDVWYSYTPNASGLHNILLTETFNNGTSGTGVNVYEGVCGSITQLGFTTNGGNFNLNLNEGTPYLLRVFYTGSDPSYSEFDLCIIQVPPPANDTCSSPSQIDVASDNTCSNKRSGSTKGATITAANGCSAEGKDVWYEFKATATADFLFEVEEIDDIGGNGTFVTVYSGNCGVLSQIGTGCSDFDATVPLLLNNIYYINVRSSNTDTISYVDFELCVKQVTPPVNDEQAMATTLIVGSSNATIPGTLSFATNSLESGPASCGSTSGFERDVWYKFTAPANGTIIIETSEGATGNFDTVLVLYDADGTTELACNDNSHFNRSFSRIIYQGLTPGSTYFVELHCYNDRAFGDFLISAYSLNCSGDIVTWGVPTPNGPQWTPNAPNANDIAVIDEDYNTEDYGDINACGLKVNLFHTLVVSPGGYINIEKDITVEGTLLVEPTASVVQIDDNASMINSGTTSVLVETTDLDVLDFIVMGSPMDSERREGVWESAWNVQNYTPQNFNPIMGIIGYNFLDEELDDWNEYENGVLRAGEGYLVLPQESYNGAGGVFSYNHTTGSLTNGVVTRSLNYNTTQLDSPNMLSNPYASAIDADEFLNFNDDIDGLYFWEHILAPDPMFPGANTAAPNYSMGDVSFYNLTGSMGSASGSAIPTNIISTAQGFAVFSNNPGRGFVRFNNSMRLTTGNTTFRSTETDKNRLWLNIKSTAYDVEGNTLVGFLEGATEGFDNKYDSERIATFVSIFSHIDVNETGYAIQGREVFDSAMTVSLGFSSIIEEETTYIISLSNFDGLAWETNTPYLIDNVTGIATNLYEGSYSFTSDIGIFNHRFTLVFENEQVLGTNEVFYDSVAIYPNPAKNVLNIASTNAEISNVEIIDLKGRVLFSKAVDPQRVTNVDVSSLASAVYFVAVTTVQGSITKRIVKE